jgi:hypothetical protein
MAWTPLPKGEFTGIDWAQPGKTTGADPYLIWAESDRFAGYGGGQPKRMPVVIELKKGKTIDDLLMAGGQWLYVPPAYTGPAAPVGLRFCSARVKPAFFTEILPGGALAGVVARAEMGLPAGPHTKAPEDLLSRRLARGAPLPLLSGPVAGLIDGGLAFAHANFLRNGQTRIKYFWRQDDNLNEPEDESRLGPAPDGFNYGHELTGADIDDATAAHTYNGLVDESAVYSEFKLFSLEKSVNHGTHVLDLMCGPHTLLAQIAGSPPDLDAPPSWAMADDAASHANIVAVQLDYDTVADTSGGSMNVHILDGLLYILSRCTDDAKLTVNLSWGTLSGPHDGSSILEEAMDQLIDLRKGRLQIVLPVSNSYQLRTHANVTLPCIDPETLQKTKHATLYWKGLPGDTTQNFLELWFPQGAKSITIEITPPGRDALPSLTFGESRIWTDGGNKPLCALIYPKMVATGKNGTSALLAIAPTSSFDASTATAPSGIWKIRLCNTDAKGAAITIDAYVERDDEAIDIPTGARQSHFEDGRYTSPRNRYDMDAFVDDPTNGTLIRRSGNFNSIATGRKTLSVGGVRVTPSSPQFRWAHYSPQKPDPDASRRSRPGVKKIPDTEAYSDETAAMLGVRAAGTRSTAVVRLVGTSDASPQVARRIINALAEPASTSAPAAS